MNRDRATDIKDKKTIGLANFILKPEEIESLKRKQAAAMNVREQPVGDAEDDHDDHEDEDDDDDDDQDDVDDDDQDDDDDVDDDDQDDDDDVDDGNVNGALDIGPITNAAPIAANTPTSATAAVPVAPIADSTPTSSAAAPVASLAAAALTATTASTATGPGETVRAGAIEDDLEVSITGEQTVEQRNQIGFANAIDLEAEEKKQDIMKKTPEASKLGKMMSSAQEKVNLLSEYTEKICKDSALKNHKLIIANPPYSLSDNPAQKFCEKDIVYMIVACTKISLGISIFFRTKATIGTFFRVWSRMTASIPWWSGKLVNLAINKLVIKVFQAILNKIEQLKGPDRDYDNILSKFDVAYVAHEIRTGDETKIIVEQLKKLIKRKSSEIITKGPGIVTNVSEKIITKATTVAGNVATGATEFAKRMAASLYLKPQDQDIVEEILQTEIKHIAHTQLTRKMLKNKNVPFLKALCEKKKLECDGTKDAILRKLATVKLVDLQEDYDSLAQNT